MFKYIQKSIPVEQDVFDPSQGMFPADFVANFFLMPNGGVLEKFSFNGREYLVPIYNTDAKKILLMFGRQSEKSTFLGNKILTFSMLRKYFRTLFVSPTQLQTETFSKDRISTPIEISPYLKVFTRGEGTKDNVLFKRFSTKSEVTFRYAYLDADRARGIPADLLIVDEVQDILADVIPIVEECLTASKFKMRCFSGTPKSVDNTLNVYWENQSTQYEFAIPCEPCGHWNIITTLDNIGDKYLICSRCGKQLFPENPRSHWVSMRSPDWLKNPPFEPFEGYHIPQVITPNADWPAIITKLKTYPQGVFMNEVLGVAFDSATKLLEKSDIQANCDPNLTMKDSHKKCRDGSTYMGIDWGGGGVEQTSHTALVVGRYIQDKFTILLAKRFTGREAEIPTMLAEIKRLITLYNIDIVGVDYGGGLDKNDDLIRTFGIKRIFRYQYVNSKRLYFDSELARFMVNRTEGLMAVINAIKRKDTFKFPKWTEFEEPFAADLCAIFGEYARSTNTMTIAHTPGTPDDTLHALLYCFFASMIKYPRPDIIAPSSEEDNSKRRR